MVLIRFERSFWKSKQKSFVLFSSIIFQFFYSLILFWIMATIFLWHEFSSLLGHGLMNASSFCKTNLAMQNDREKAKTSSEQKLNSNKSKRKKKSQQNESRTKLFSNFSLTRKADDAQPTNKQIDFGLTDIWRFALSFRYFVRAKKSIEKSHRRRYAEKFFPFTSFAFEMVYWLKHALSKCWVKRSVCTECLNTERLKDSKFFLLYRICANRLFKRNS